MFGLGQIDDRPMRIQRVESAGGRICCPRSRVVVIGPKEKRCEPRNSSDDHCEGLKNFPEAHGVLPPVGSFSVARSDRANSNRHAMKRTPVVTGNKTNRKGLPTRNHQVVGWVTSAKIHRYIAATSRKRKKKTSSTTMSRDSNVPPLALRRNDRTTQLPDNPPALATLRRVRLPQQPRHPRPG